MSLHALDGKYCQKDLLILAKKESKNHLKINEREKKNNDNINIIYKFI